MTKSFTRIIVLSFIILSTHSLISIPAFAEDKKLSVSEANPIKAGLDALVSKSATVQLSSGQEISGIIEEVGPQVVRVSQLSGKEFFSALVKIENIVAIVYRAK